MITTLDSNRIVYVLDGKYTYILNIENMQENYLGESTKQIFRIHGDNKGNLWKTNKNKISGGHLIINVDYEDFLDNNSIIDAFFYNLNIDENYLIADGTKRIYDRFFQSFDHRGITHVYDFKTGKRLIIFKDSLFTSNFKNWLLIVYKDCVKIYDLTSTLIRWGIPWSKYNFKIKVTTGCFLDERKFVLVGTNQITIGEGDNILHEAETKIVDASKVLAKGNYYLILEKDKCYLYKYPVQFIFQKSCIDACFYNEYILTINENEINCIDNQGNILKNYDILHGKNLPEKKKVIDSPDTETDDEKKQCKLCCKNMANTCYSCGHVFSCTSCVNKNPKKECAICRAIPTTITKFYWP